MSLQLVENPAEVVRRKLMVSSPGELLDQFEDWALGDHDVNRVGPRTRRRSQKKCLVNAVASQSTSNHGKTSY